MDPEMWILIGVVGVTTVIFAAVVAVILRSYVRVESGKALVVTQLERVNVYFTGGLVIPLVHRGEVIDISVKTLEIDRRGKDGLICKDRIRADITAQFFVRVNTTAEDVLKVAQSIGCARAGDQAVIEGLFVAKFREALETVAAQLDFVQLYNQREEFREQVLEVIGRDLDGYLLDDLAIDFLEQTPVDQLDSRNVLDAEGIKKIVEITEQRKTERAEIENRGRQRRLKLDTLVAELEHRKADVLGRFQRDVGRELTEADLREKIAELLVEHFGPRIGPDEAKALVDQDAQASSAS